MLNPKAAVKARVVLPGLRLEVVLVFHFGVIVQMILMIAVLLQLVKEINGTNNANKSTKSLVLCIIKLNY